MAGRGWLSRLFRAFGRDQRGNAVKTIDMGDDPTFYYTPVWSPDSTKIAYGDRRLNLWYVDVASGKRVKVDTNPIGFTDGVLEPSWSPDSKWIAYARHLPKIRSSTTMPRSTFSIGMRWPMMPVDDGSTS